MFLVVPDMELPLDIGQCHFGCMLVETGQQHGQQHTDQTGGETKAERRTFRRRWRWRRRSRYRCSHRFRKGKVDPGQTTPLLVAIGMSAATVIAKTGIGNTQI